MKKRLTAIIASLICLAIGLGIFLNITDIFRDKDGVGKNKRLISAGREDYDVLFLGSSHMGPIPPVYFWNNYGFTSYNIYNRGDGMDRYLAILKNVFEYVHPRLIVIDTDKYWNSLELEKNLGEFHRAFDSFPLTRTKFESVTELVSDPEGRKELLFDFYRYHSRYNSLLPEDFTGIEDRTLGANLRYESTPRKRPQPIAPDLMPEEDNDESMLRELIGFCQDNGVEVLLITLPYPAAGEGDQRRYNRAREIAAEYGINYLSFIGNDSMLDYLYDFRDAGHFNMSGSIKLSRALGDYIETHYELPDHRGDEVYEARWQAYDQDYFVALKESLLHTPENYEIDTLEEALVLMSMEYFSGEIYLKNANTGILRRKGIVELIENAVSARLPLSDDGSRKGKSGFGDEGIKRLPILREAADLDENYLLIFNRKAGTVQEFRGADVDDIIGDSHDMDDVLITYRDARSPELDYAGEYRE